MLPVNLLPTKEKKVLRLEEIRRIIILFTIASVAILSTASVLIMPSFLPLFLEYLELERRAAIEEEAANLLKINEAGSNVSNIRKKIKDIKNTAHSPTKISKIFNSLFRKEAGITISEMRVQKQGNLVINGVADTRKALLDFEKKLRDSNLVQDISCPFSCIIKETDINFTFQGKLKL